MISPTCETLIEMLANKAMNVGFKPAFTFQGRAVTYDELWQSVNQFGAHLLELGFQRGDSAVIAIPNSEDFFYAFYGVLKAGGVAVPIFPGAGAERIISIARMSEARIIVLPDAYNSKISLELRRSAESERIRFTSVSSAQTCLAGASFPKTYAEDLAFIQFTSGSTGAPKGVQISHHNLLTNIQQMIAGMKITPYDVFVSWLPVYHDMGLILMTMTPFSLAAETHLLPTDVRDVTTWLRKIQETKATFTAAPDFAYRLCCRRIERPEEFDISSLRVALNAAEPVRASTIQEFESRFRLKHVMTAGYGLAEATVGVSMSDPGMSVHVDERGLVSVGQPFEGVEIQIRKNGLNQLPGEVGEITIRSRANARGYFADLEETSRAFLPDGSLRTGDLGYLDASGNMYISGRAKAVIKRFGETISPQEIEEAIDRLPAVRFCAAIGIDRGGLEGEQIYIFAELRDASENETGLYYEISIQIVNAMQNRMGFRPGRVYLLKANAIPRTYNGKIQHVVLKENYLKGRLREGKWILYPDF